MYDSVQSKSSERSVGTQLFCTNLLKSEWPGIFVVTAVFVMWQKPITHTRVTCVS